MRDWSRINSYYQELLGDVYPQEPDDWHLAEMQAIIYNWIAPLGISSVLDVGSANYYALPFFEAIGVAYRGLDLEKEGEDFNFLDTNVCDLVFARHTLEHSPFPILTLMEWWGFSTKYLCVIMPNPEWQTYVGRNHYSVSNPQQIMWWLRRAGWKPTKLLLNDREFRFLCEKAPRVGYEGYAEAPIGQYIYELERDLKIDGNEVDVDAYFRNREAEAEKHRLWVEKMRRKGRLL